RKEVLCKIANHAHGVFCPAQRNQVPAQRDPLRESILFDDLAQLYVVQHFKPQLGMCAHLVVHRAASQVESAHAHMVFSTRIGNFPGTMTEDEKNVEECQHHSLPHAEHNQGGNQHQVIGLTFLGVSNRSAQAVRTESNVGVGKQQPVARSLLC